MIKISSEFVQERIDVAKNDQRQRSIFNFHESSEDLLQRMVNALEPGTYVQPHKHEKPPKREVFIILTGSAVVIEFSEEGGIADHVVLKPGNNFGVEILPGIWHSLIPLQPGTVLYEVKDGPYDPSNDKQFAPWAPAEDDPQAPDFNEQLLVKLGLK